MDKNDSCFEESLPRHYKKNMNEFSMISPNEGSILDKTKLSSRESMMFLEVVANEMGEDINTGIVSRATLECHRKKDHYFQNNQMSQCDFPLVVHWDGKLLMKTIKKKVERHAIVVTGIFFLISAGSF